MKMKKMLFLVLTLSAWTLMTVVSMSQTTTASQPAPSKDATTVSTNCGKCFVDKNNDGICDNQKTCQAKPQGKGVNFTDKDKNGVCDHREAMKGDQKSCTGKGVGQKGCCPGQQGCCPGHQGCGKGNGCGKGSNNSQTTTPEKK
jgi:hypothetical protein